MRVYSVVKHSDMGDREAEPYSVLIGVFGSFAAALLCVHRNSQTGYVGELAEPRQKELIWDIDCRSRQWPYEWQYVIRAWDIMEELP